MACVLKGSHSFTCTPRVRPQRNESYLPFPFQPKLVLIYWPQRDKRLSCPRNAPGDCKSLCWTKSEIRNSTWYFSEFYSEGVLTPKLPLAMIFYKLNVTLRRLRFTVLNPNHHYLTFRAFHTTGVASRQWDYCEDDDEAIQIRLADWEGNGGRGRTLRGRVVRSKDVQVMRSDSIATTGDSCVTCRYRVIITDRPTYLCRLWTRSPGLQQHLRDAKCVTVTSSIMRTQVYCKFTETSMIGALGS